MAAFNESSDEAARVLDIVQATARIHHGAALDALEDLSDLVPKGVAELREGHPETNSGPLPLSPGSVHYTGERSND